jgi:hypothetical protein
VQKKPEAATMLIPANDITEKVNALEAARRSEEVRKNEPWIRR